MPTIPPPQNELEAMREYWRFYEPRAREISLELRKAAEHMPDFAPLLRSMTPAQMDEQDKRALALQKAAIVDGAWEPYLADLRTQGMTYAQMGLAFAAWFDILSAFRVSVRHRINAELEAGGKWGRLSPAVDGMNRLLDIAMAEIGQAYLDEKQRLIQRQQEAIRELSTPVLQVRDQLLILPVVGVIDTQRARGLTEAMLQAIREKRARAVVMDITGVPIVDSKVANHLAQACEAARLMGATAIVTGISAQIAQTLVTVGAELEGAITLGDLEAGIEEAERIIGYTVERRLRPAANGNGKSKGNGKGEEAPAQ